MNKDTPWYQRPTFLLPLGWLTLIILAYGNILLHPDLHFACPENDTWNFPVRYWTAQSLSNGHLPLWNSQVGFGVPWLASWATEVLYPGTLLFTWLGLSAWNLSGVLHLFIFSIGIYCFLRSLNVAVLGAFVSSAIALTNACAINHLGSNAPMDAMAWIPWVFIGVHETLEEKPWGAFKLGAALTLQILAGYPHTLFYTVICGSIYGFVFFRNLKPLIVPGLVAAALTAAQWLPSVEYLFFQAIRLPAVPNNPDFVLPLKNLLTFLTSHALREKNLVDYVASPTYFYFNFYSSSLPLLILAIGLYHFKKWNKPTCFWTAGFGFSILWTFGFFNWAFGLVHLALPAFLEPAKAWVLVDFFELIAMGFLFQYLNFGKPWHRWLLAVFFISLLTNIWLQPTEKNLTPPDKYLTEKAKFLQDHLGTGRLLALPSQEEYSKLYTPQPDPEPTAHFKYFGGNSNLYAGLPSANFYSSTWPSWGALDASLYYKYGFPYRGHLLDLLGVDLLLMDQKEMPKNFKKVGSLDGWGLWQNPASVGDHFFTAAQPRTAERKDIFTTFATGVANPLKDLYLGKEPLPFNDRYGGPSGPHFDLKEHPAGFFIVTQNALPGWKAWVDGKPTPIFLADGMFQGIPLDKQSGAVDLSYEPVSFRLGLFISLLALAGLWAGLLLKV